VRIWRTPSESTDTYKRQGKPKADSEASNEQSSASFGGGGARLDRIAVPQELPTSGHGEIIRGSTTYGLASPIVWYKDFEGDCGKAMLFELLPLPQNQKSSIFESMKSMLPSNYKHFESPFNTASTFHTRARLALNRAADELAKKAHAAAASSIRTYAMPMHPTGIIYSDSSFLPDHVDGVAGFLVLFSFGSRVISTSREGRSI
jgi:hypothetical protein